MRNTVAIRHGSAVVFAAPGDRSPAFNPLGPHPRTLLFPRRTADPTR